MGCGSSVPVEDKHRQHRQPAANGHAQRPQGGHGEPSDQQLYNTPPRTPTPAPRSPTPAPRTPTPAPRTPTPAPRTPSPVVVDNPTPPPPRTPSAGSTRSTKQEEPAGEQEPVAEHELMDGEQEPGKQEVQEGEQEPQTKGEHESQTEDQVQQEPQPEGEQDTEPPTENEPEAIEERVRVLPPLPADGEDEDMADDADPHLTERDQGREFHMGRQVTYLDARTDKTLRDNAVRPTVKAGELYKDPDFGFEVAMEGLAPDAEWKRPTEFREQPTFFTDGSTRFDVGQGSAGTCYFLSILASIADKPEVLKQVMPEGAYKVGCDDYDGVFHCRFWRFGDWDDVYIDDCLPVVNGSVPWGAQSSTDPNEMWVSLMEKAFAKFIGSYKQAEGGWAGDAFTALTGGTVERIDMKETSRTQLFERISNGLLAGSVVSCSVPSAMDGQMGLVGGHAYTMTGTTSVAYKGKKTPLVRIRNPWGMAKGEWTGAWADGAPEWQAINHNAVDRVQTQGKGDGEFWMSLPDFFTYFGTASICNFVPDFDKDGIPDGLTQLSVMYGEWHGESAAGCDAAKRFLNQKYTFTVPDTGVAAIPVVLQFMRHQQNRRADNDCFIRLDCYKVEAEKTSDRDYFVLDELTNKTTFWGGADITYRYTMAPGRYLVLPTTMEPGVERHFCIRLFAAVDIQCRSQETIPGIYIRRDETEFEHKGVQYMCTNMSTLFGEWKDGVNAGGQIANRSFPSNPQYQLDIAGDEQVPLFVSLMQVNEEPRLSLGFKIYPLGEGMSAPLDLRAAWNQAGTCIRDVDGATVFVVAYEGAAKHVVAAGSYVLIPFTNTPGVETQFALTLATSTSCSIAVREFNTT